MSIILLLTQVEKSPQVLTERKRSRERYIEDDDEDGGNLGTETMHLVKTANTYISHPFPFNKEKSYFSILHL
jgi:hypothetical protein